MIVLLNVFHNDYWSLVMWSFCNWPGFTIVPPTRYKNDREIFSILIFYSKKNDMNVKRRIHTVWKSFLTFKEENLLLNDSLKICYALCLFENCFGFLFLRYQIIQSISQNFQITNSNTFMTEFENLITNVVLWVLVQFQTFST